MNNTKTMNAMKYKIALGRKQLGLDDATYTEMMRNLTGKESSTKCTAAQLARVIDHLATRGAVFTSAKEKRPEGSQYKTKAAQRRTDFYEIADSTPHAPIKRLICALWAKLGYDMTSLDTRVKRQTGVEFFRWVQDEKYLSRLANSLQLRLARKQKKQAVTCE